MTAIVAPEPEDDCRADTTAADPLFKELTAHTRAHCKSPQMLTGPVEGAFLRMLVQLSGARRVLEIGTYTGYSALSMAAGLHDGDLITCDIDPDTSAIAQSFFDRSPHGGKILSSLRGRAIKTVASLPAELPFDVVFIDADKESCIDYYEATLAAAASRRPARGRQRAVAPGGCWIRRRNPRSRDRSLLQRPRGARSACREGAAERA
ncbi:MAG: class I SAM-dependent methyltransferase [Chromatiales bacterium]|nr:class I SAM-dependent methyltransferase [Chromatiales bacterium]